MDDTESSSDPLKQKLNVIDMMGMFLVNVPKVCPPDVEKIMRLNNQLCKDTRDQIWIKISQQGKVPASSTPAIVVMMDGVSNPLYAQMGKWDDHEMYEIERIPELPFIGTTEDMLHDLFEQVTTKTSDELYDMGVFASSSLRSCFINALEYRDEKCKWDACFSQSDVPIEWFRLYNLHTKKYRGEGEEFRLLLTEAKRKDIDRRFGIVSYVTPLSDDVCTLDPAKKYYTLHQARDVWFAKIKRSEYPDVRRVKEKNNELVKLYVQNVAKHLLRSIPDDEEDDVIRKSKVSRDDMVIEYSVLKYSFEQFWNYVNVKKCIDHLDVVYRSGDDEINYWIDYVLSSDVEDVWRLGPGYMIKILRFVDMECRLRTGLERWERFFSTLPNLLSEEEVDGSDILRADEICEDINMKFYNPWVSPDEYEEFITLINTVAKLRISVR